GTNMMDNAPALMQIAKRAAAQLPDSSGLKIAVSPDDHASFKRLLEDEASMMALVCETTVESGTCRIISNQQDILVDPVEAVAAYLNELRPDLTQLSATEKSNQASETIDEQES
ncbi:MAG: hypothetical protein ACE5E3_02945, partial [Mariprofundus sp.]